MRMSTRNRRAVLLVRGVFVIVALVGLGMIAGGITSIIHKESGMKARATITECHRVDSRYSTYQCDGTWVEGGSLVGGKGHVVFGVVDDAEPSQIGKTIDVRVSGDHAYTLSLRVPIILLILGGLMALGGVVLMVVAGRQPPARAPMPTILSAAPTSEAQAGETQ
jgi:hypothetical protein